MNNLQDTELAIPAAWYLAKNVNTNSTLLLSFSGGPAAPQYFYSRRSQRIITILVTFSYDKDAEHLNNPPTVPVPVPVPVPTVSLCMSIRELDGIAPPLVIVTASNLHSSHAQVN